MSNVVLQLKKKYGNGKVFCSTSPSMSFPAVSLQCSYYQDEDKMTVITTALGLVGVDAPIIDELARLMATNQTLRHEIENFLDVFVNRLYSLSYLAWTKLDYIQHVKSNQLKPSGFFAGNKNIRVIQYVLCWLYPSCIIQVLPRSCSWVFIDEPATSLNPTTGGRLGDNAVLGNRVLVKGGGLEVSIAFQRIDDYRQWLLNDENKIKLSQLLSEFVPRGVKVMLILKMHVINTTLSTLGKAKFGKCFLGSSHVEMCL